MKVKVTLQQVITYEDEVEVEMTQAQYKAYLKGDIEVSHKLIQKAESICLEPSFADSETSIVGLEKL